MSSYRGRFAPSPTGPLHVGSLIAAAGSYLQARSAGGQWLVRIEDLDPPREVPGSADSILHTLEALGFEWDGPVLRQSTRAEAYEAALRQLAQDHLIYPCSCSRSEILSLVGEPPPEGEELRYPGTCRFGATRNTGPFAQRLRVPDEPVTFTDRVQGLQSADLAASIGDFVVRRRDGLYAYQLAVVVDDAAQGISEVVRGADLLLNTPRQIALQHALHLQTPDYVHLPMVVDAQGKKLSKSSQAPALDPASPGEMLWLALHLLQQLPPQSLRRASPREVWSWAYDHWSLASLTGRLSVPAPAVST